MDLKLILESMQKFVYQERFVLGVLEDALNQPNSNRKDILEASKIVRDIFDNKLESILYATKLDPGSVALIEELQAIRPLPYEDGEDLLQFIKRWIGED